jgi:hypothetical protein
MRHRLPNARALPLAPFALDAAAIFTTVNTLFNHSQEMIPHFPHLRVVRDLPDPACFDEPLDNPACEFPHLDGGLVVPNVVRKVVCRLCCFALTSTYFLSYPSSSLTNGVVYTLMGIFAVTFVVRVFLTPGMKVEPFFVPNVDWGLYFLSRRLGVACFRANLCA